MKIPINKEFSFVNFSLETHSLNGSSPKQSHHCQKKNWFVINVKTFTATWIKQTKNNKANQK